MLLLSATEVLWVIRATERRERSEIGRQIYGRIICAPPEMTSLFLYFNICAQTFKVPSGLQWGVPRKTSTGWGFGGREHERLYRKPLIYNPSLNRQRPVGYLEKPAELVFRGTLGCIKGTSNMSAI